MPYFENAQQVDDFYLPKINEVCAEVHACLLKIVCKIGSDAVKIEKAEREKCQQKGKKYYDGLGEVTCADLKARHQAELKKFQTPAKGGGGGGGPPFVPSKKIEPPDPLPPPPVKLVSFGKLFLSFCLPALSRLAEQEGIDEVQVNFYQLNESCGPVSLHSISEFPIEIDRAEQLFADFCASRGGESMTVMDFVDWCGAKLFGDMRSVGYGMRQIYEPQSNPKPEAAKKDEKAEKEAAEASKGQQQAWFAKYGKFKPPILGVKMDTIYAGENSKTDLLYKFTNRIGGRINQPPPRYDSSQKKITDRIFRVDIYDRAYNPYDKQSRIFKDLDGSYRVFDGNPTAEQAQKYLSNYAVQYLGSDNNGELKIEQTPGANTSRLSIDGVSVSRTIPKGKNVLRDYVADLTPTLIVGGTNSTMIMSAQVQSKTDGLNSARLLTGGSYKAKSTISPSGLAMAENELPLRALPAELTLGTMGCPILQARQQFFVDFGTGTTLDNLYSIKQVQHNFANGKYDCSMTMQFIDGYAQFFGANGVQQELQAIAGETLAKQEAQEAANEQTANVGEKQNYANLPNPSAEEAKK